ncbi:hypothetical protein V493_02604 [Pseudogymnoascus sp. VKM F-4281 (FW-2241)]|nr:hypothetical protein V493_02604 [Pseudogymnoascus sp. VKM F-4281 (FW-2241)]
MVNRYKRRNSRPRAGTSFMSNYGPRHRPRPTRFQPPLPNHAGAFNPKPAFSPDQYFHGISSIFAERACLLSSLQREDLRATGLLTIIADINTRMASGAPMWAREAKYLRRDLAAKRHAADVSVRQEKLLLQRLGEVTLVIQQRERWYKVERERGMGAGIGGGARLDVRTGGNTWGDWNGPNVASWNGQQVLCGGQPQGYYGGQGWGQQLPPPGYVMIPPPTYTEDCGPIGHNYGQVHAPVNSCSDWDMSRVSEGDAAEQGSPQKARSYSMVELSAAVRTRAQGSMSMPDLSSRSLGGDYPRYLGYYSSGCSLEIVGGSDN